LTRNTSEMRLRS